MVRDILAPSPEDGVLDLTPHLNDPREHIRNVLKRLSFCGHEFDLGDREPPVVPMETIIQGKPIESNDICGYSCLDIRYQEGHRYTSMPSRVTMDTAAASTLDRRSVSKTMVSEEMQNDAKVEDKDEAPKAAILT